GGCDGGTGQVHAADARHRALPGRSLQRAQRERGRAVGAGEPGVDLMPTARRRRPVDRPLTAKARATVTVPCLLEAWAAHEAELLRYLRDHVCPAAEAEDVLHDLFLKALRQGERFCAVSNPRAWLSEVARRARRSAPLPEDLAASEFEPAEAFALLTQEAGEPGLAPVDLLSACLPRALTELAAEDREALELCDIGGMSQKAFAELKGLSL